MAEQRDDSVKRYVGGLVLLGLLVPCSCANNFDNTRQAFAQKELCPPARVTVTERPMTLAEFQGDAGASGGHSFPGDPEREQYAAKLDNERAQFANELVGDVYEVSGCGVRALYWCHTQYRGKSQSEVCDPLRASAILITDDMLSGTMVLGVAPTNHHARSSPSQTPPWSGGTWIRVNVLAPGPTTTPW